MKKTNSKPYTGIFCVLFAAILWGSMGVFVRYLNAAGLSALEVTQVRITVGLIAIASYLAIFKRDLLKIKLKDIWCFLGTGVVSLLFFSTCYFKSIEYGTSLSVAAILLYTAPIFVMLMSLVLFKEKMTVVKLIALILAFGGCILVSGVAGDMGNVTGIVLAIASGFFYALYSIFSRYAINKGYGSLTIVFYTFLFCTIGCSCLADWRTITSVVLTPNIKIILLCIGLGIITGFLPYVFYSRGLELMESSKASILASVEPVVGTLFGVFLFHEPLTLLGGIGIALVLGAVVLLSVKKKDKNDR
ncbi:MAG: EamA family transporter [Clostridia bacterium]|nr:EamA family transporter [Clostridia bacterium]